MNAAPPAAASQPAPLKVLVVDDDTAIAAGLVEFLAAMDIGAIARLDVQAGLRAIRDDPGITVVVSDVRMPGRDGISFAADIAAERTGAEAVSVVLITAYTSAAVADVVDRQQIFAFLQKPFRPQALLKLVRLAHEATLARRSQTARAPAPDAPAMAIRAPSTPADILQDVAASIPAATRAARRVCTLADSSAQLGARAEGTRDVLRRLVNAVIAATSDGTVLSLSVLDCGPDVEFRIDITPAMLGNVAANATHLNIETALASLVSIQDDVRQIDGRLIFAPFPTAVTLSGSLFIARPETVAGT